MTMDIIDKRIYSCNEAICKNIESLQANERGLLSQNILSQLRNFLECVFLKIYVASGNSLIENEYQNIKNAIKFINTLQGKYRFLNQFHKLLQISVSHYTLDPDSSERLMLKYYEYLLRIKTFMKDNYGIELLENLHKFPLNKKFLRNSSSVCGSQTIIFSFSPLSISDNLYLHLPRNME